MFKLEAQWVGDRLAAMAGDELGIVLNVGSSTLKFRTERQPWIDELIFAPLRSRGVGVVHADLKEGDGVDITADLMTDEGFAAIKGLNPRTVLCCNILEHVLEPDLLAARLEELVPEGGHIVVTVPRSYPHHRDPIDTMYRPTPEEAAGLFSRSELVEAEILATGSYRDNVKERPLIVFRHVFRFPFPMFGWQSWKRSMRKLGWLFNPYLVSCLVLRRR